MKKFFYFLFFICITTNRLSAHIIYDNNIKSLQVVVNDDWLTIPIMKLNTSDFLNISFDQLSHIYHRYIYKIEHCDANWHVSNSLLESDYLNGFNNNIIDKYEESINTSVLYTHYSITIPNERCKLIMSGNYRLIVFDEDDNNKEVIEARFMVLDPLMNVGLSVTTNTDIDVNKSHQQIQMNLNYNGIYISNPIEQIHTIVVQNGINGESVIDAKPDYIKNDGLQWIHNKNLIFDAGNEYYKFESLSTNHPTMGIDHIDWDGYKYNVYPFINFPRKSYIYDEDANGAFYIRNSNNSDNDITCDYMLVNYKLKMDSDNIRQIEFLKNNCTIMVNGNWTNNYETNEYKMSYNYKDNSFNTSLLQKQGYYSYRYKVINNKKLYVTGAIEPSFYQTENKYHALVYYRKVGGRTDLLVGYANIDFK